MEPNDAETIQYLGVASITEFCLDGLRMLLQHRLAIEHAHLLSCDQEHGFLLETTLGVWGIKPGFASGYGGEGAKGLAIAIRALMSRNIMISEHFVDRGMMRRLSDGKISRRDLERLLENPPTYSRWPIYLQISSTRSIWDQQADLWDQPMGIPFALVDERIMDLANRFWNNPDDALLAGYRRLEDTVRQRIQTDKHGIKVFQRAFSNSTPLLRWEECEQAEQQGRCDLFCAAYSSFRNPRAHREIETHPKLALQELLLLSYLFSLERTAVPTAKD